MNCKVIYTCIESLAPKGRLECVLCLVPCGRQNLGQSSHSQEPYLVGSVKGLLVTQNRYVINKMWCATWMSGHAQERLCASNQLLHPVPWMLSTSSRAGIASALAVAAWGVASDLPPLSQCTHLHPNPQRPVSKGWEHPSLCPGFLSK